MSFSIVHGCVQNSQNVWDTISVAWFLPCSNSIYVSNVNNIHARRILLYYSWSYVMCMNVRTHGNNWTHKFTYRKRFSAFGFAHCVPETRRQRAIMSFWRETISAIVQSTVVRSTNRNVSSEKKKNLKFRRGQIYLIKIKSTSPLHSIGLTLHCS